MATSLDLQEQEQLDAVKAFWNRYGNLITWVLVLVLGGFAAWNGWQWYQRDQAARAGALYDELDRAATAGDVEKATRAFADLRQRHGGTAWATQGGLLVAKVQFDKGKADDARASLAWVAEHAKDAAIGTVARLRLAALQAEAKQYDEAMKTLEAAKAEGFEALVADRKGDVLMLQGRRDEARNAWTVAYAAMSDKVEYRRLVEAKLAALGTPAAAASAAPVSSAPSAAAPAGRAASTAASAAAAASK
ncbi:MAG: tetratricopeptide repeat protein [Rubrivivax sp.]|nr:tetratricopeptide repeat protein [Rubrivivax sp.]